MCQLNSVRKTACKDPVSMGRSGIGFKVSGLLTGFWTTCTLLWQGKSYYSTWESPVAPLKPSNMLSFKCVWSNGSLRGPRSHPVDLLCRQAAVSVSGSPRLSSVIQSVWLYTKFFPPAFLCLYHIPPFKKKKDYLVSETDTETNCALLQTHTSLKLWPQQGFMSHTLTRNWEELLEKRSSADLGKHAGGSPFGAIVTSKLI